MEELLKELRAFKCPPPDPSEFIERSDNATMSKLMIGNQNSKGYVPTPEEREQRRQTMLGVKHTTERRRRQSEEHKGVKLSKEHVNSIIKARVGRKWYNNGKINKFCHECPGGFVNGMLKRKQRD